MLCQMIGKGRILQTLHEALLMSKVLTGVPEHLHSASRQFRFGLGSQKIIDPTEQLLMLRINLDIANFEGIIPFQRHIKPKCIFIPPWRA